MKNKKLLFFFSDENCSACPTVVPTLKGLAESVGIEFESYICTRPMSWQGKVFPALGHGHIESFYYLANFYDEILYCSISSYGSFQFRREVLAFGGKVLSARSNNEVAEFYRDVFSFFGKSLPETAIVLPDRKEGKNYYTPFCYPDIVRLSALGVSESVWNKQKEFLYNAGVKKVTSLYCDIADAEVIDEVKDGDTYGSVTLRIAERNIENAKQIGFIDQDNIFRWQTHFMSKNVITLYEDYDWIPFSKNVAEFAKKLDNYVIIGSQVVYDFNKKKVTINDAIIAEFGKYNMIMNLVGVSPRLGFNIQTEKHLPLDWLEDENVKTPWDDEYTDEYLEERLEKGDIPVCFLFYAADLGHLPVLPNFMNMMVLDGMRAGIAFPSTWYQYQPEILEQLYIPLEQGGVCPNLEPLLSSAGSAVATEAEGFIDSNLLSKLISDSMEDIKGYVGERRLPRGYYPFQDSSPFYAKDSGKPQYDLVAKHGFEYYITYKNDGKPAAIEFENETMTVLRQQTEQWFPGYGDVMGRLLEWEDRCIENQNKRLQGEQVENLVDWIILSFDTPFFGLTPNCFGESDNATNKLYRENVGMERIFKAMQYIRHTGGKEGRLFLVKPHELNRFAKIAEKKGYILPLSK